MNYPLMPPAPQACADRGEIECDGAPNPFEANIAIVDDFDPSSMTDDEYEAMMTRLFGVSR